MMSLLHSMQALTEVGTVQAVLPSGDLRVVFSGNSWTVNINAVVKVRDRSCGIV